MPICYSMKGILNLREVTPEIIFNSYLKIFLHVLNTYEVQNDNDYVTD